VTNVISLGEDAFGDDPEELEKREIPIPPYLLKMQPVLTGPKVFKFHGW